MRIDYTGRSVSLGDRERTHLEQKIGRLARHFSSAREARVTHSVLRNWHIIEVVVDLDGTLLRAEARTADALLSIDEVADKLDHQVRKLKEKIKHHKGRANAPTVANLLAENPEEPEPVLTEPLPAIVRRKRFTIEAMTPDEASLQMELLNHDFFAFLDAESGLTSVVYRRRDGNFGLLELVG